MQGRMFPRLEVVAEKRTEDVIIGDSDLAIGQDKP